MRTTITIDDGLLADARKAALESGQSLGHLVEDALRERLSRRRDMPSRRPELPLSGAAGGLQPGVNLDDGAAVLDRMDGPGRR
jgi:hypothetical protein